ncbi:MAG TPA: DnaJ domain-containing protein [Rubrobacteraceae bacterium]|nr:DnaJ domain-containing protein [Rubrobacteraceae bacterium]
MRTTTDLYKLLGVPRGATQDDIRKAHRKLVRKHHPDANPGDHSSEERFREVQRAYEVLSDPEKRREYDKGLSASTRGSSGKQRARAGGRTGGENAAPPVDLSDLLRKLTDLSSERSGARKEGGFQLRGEEIARLAGLLGMDTSRIAELLGKDIARLSKLVGENIKMNARVNLGDARSDRHPSTSNRVSGGKQPGASNEPREKKVKGPKAQEKAKRVKGPKARRRSKDR